MASLTIDHGIKLAVEAAQSQEKSSSEADKIRDSVWPFIAGRGLDVGSGYGPVLPEAIAIDRRPHSQVDWVHEATEPLDPIPDGWCDYVFSSHLVEHLRDPKAAIALWCRKVRPGGYLILVAPDQRYTTPNPEHVHRHLTPALLRAIAPADWREVLREQAKFDYSILLVLQR